MKPEQSRALVLNDSEISSIECSSNTVIFNFSAAFVRQDSSHSGLESASGYLKSLKLICTEISSLRREDGCIGRISNGNMVVAGQQMKRIPIPFESTSGISLELQFTNGSSLHVQALGVTVKAENGAQLIESFSC